MIIDQDELLGLLNDLLQKRETQLTKEGRFTYNYGYVAGEISGIEKAILKVIEAGKKDDRV